MRNYNDWNVSFSTICFFEGALKSHRRVIQVSRRDDIFFTILRDDGCVLNTLLLNEYRFGRASLIRALEQFPETRYIVIGSNWNESTPQADEYAKDNGIGVYDINEFLGAINCNNIPLKYITRDERSNRRNTIKGTW